MNKRAEDHAFIFPIIQNSLTTQLTLILDDINHEAKSAFEENLQSKPPSAATKQQAYLEACLLYATRAEKPAQPSPWHREYFDHLLPGMLMLNRPKRLQELMKFLGRIFEERKEKLRTLGIIGLINPSVSTPSPDSQ
ncbi:hypothetical protein RUND412_008184 [Rhizina undulata]